MVLSKLTGRDFRRLRETKSFKFKTHRFLFVYKLEELAEQELRYGVTVTKKKLKKAVFRNRIKRLIRESFRKEMIHEEERLKIYPKSIKVNVVFIAPDPQKTIDSIKMQDVKDEVSSFLSEARFRLSQ